MQTSIYVLTDETGKIRYVGKTSRLLRKRFADHLHAARRGVLRTHLYTWIRSVLSRGFLPGMTLVGVVDGDGAKEETAWIKYFRDENIDLCNLTDGGEGCVGLKVSTETRERLAAANRGKRLSPEAIAKIAAANTGRKRSPEQRARISAALRGKPRVHTRPRAGVTPETRLKMSLSARGNKNCLGHHHSPETRSKIGAASRGRKRTPEIIAKWKETLRLKAEKRITPPANQTPTLGV